MRRGVTRALTRSLMHRRTCYRQLERCKNVPGFVSAAANAGSLIWGYAYMGSSNQHGEMKTPMLCPAEITSPALGHL